MVRLLNDQYSNFLQQADALRVSGALCDALISVEGQAFRAHRLVLACASRRLAQLLTQGAAHQPVNCTLELLSPHTFQQLLDFSYSQALEVPQADLHHLLRAAQLLEMQSLEEQCQKQLDALDRQATEATETAETSEATDTGTSGERQASSGSNFPKKEPQGRTSPGGEHEGSPVLDSPPSAQMKISSAPLPKKRPLVAVPAPVGLPFRDSVIAGTASSHAPPSPSRYRWHSVSALRKITLNYSDLMASHSLHSSQQIVPYPFPLSGPHMYPLLASPIPAQVHSSFMGYPGIFHPYSHTLLAGSSELGDELKKELLGKGDTSDKVLIEGGPGERTRFHGEEIADKTRRIQDCVHFSRADQQRSWRESPATSVSGGASLGCGFYGQRRKVGRSQRRGYSVEKPYQCKSCAKRFSLKHQLDTHHRVHTGEKPFECRLCGQRSRDYSAMIKHLRTHGGAMPYQCTFCLEYSSSLAAMQKHLKGHPVQDFPSDWNISSTYLYSCHT